MTSIDLDQADRKIIDVLAREGRISNLELADRIGLSPTPCSRRVKRLEDEGVITGYGARINQTMIGQSVVAVVNVSLSQKTAKDTKEFLEIVTHSPEIIECLRVTGDLDYVLRVQTKDVDTLRDFVIKKLRMIPAVNETWTMLVLDVDKASVCAAS